MYAQVLDVENALNKACTFDQDTIPSSSVVRTWLEQESEWVDEITSDEFTQETVEDVFEYKGHRKLMTKYAPIDDVLLYINENREGFEPSWDLLDEWKHYEVNKKRGVIILTRNVTPRHQRNKFKAEYSKGSNPSWLKGIVARRVAKRVVEAAINQRAQDGTQTIRAGGLTISSSRNMGVGLYQELKMQVKEDEERLRNRSGVVRYVD